MQSVTIEQEIQDLYNVVDSTIKYSTPIQIMCKTGSAVIISLQNWEAMQKTLYLASIPSHIPLAERMEQAKANGTWDGKPGDITLEDKEWLDMPAVGDEALW